MRTFACLCTHVCSACVWARVDMCVQWLRVGNRVRLFTVCALGTIVGIVCLVTMWAWLRVRVVYLV